MANAQEWDESATDRSSFRLYIARTWSAREFADQLNSFARAYEALFASIYGSSISDFHSDGFVDQIGIGQPQEGLYLQVKAFNFASPGFQDLAGVGRVIEQLRLFTENVINISLTGKQRQLEIQKLQIENQISLQELQKEKLLVAAQQIENSRQILDLCEKYELSSDQADKLRSALINSSLRISDQALLGKITGVADTGDKN